MRQSNRFIAAIAALLLLAIMLVGCGGAPAPEPSRTPAPAAPTTQPEAAAVEEDPADVPVSQAASETPPPTADNAGLVARVNGEAITQAEYDRALERRLNINAAADPVTVRQQVLDALIEQTLIEQAAPELGVIVSDDDVTAAVETLRASAPSEGDWQSFLAQNGYDETEMVEAQRQALITQGVRDGLTADLGGDVRQVNARHILVASEADAQAVLTQLQAGEPFAAVAMQHSIDMTTADIGGDLGWFTADELMDPRLAEIAFSLNPGEIAGPVPSGLGYHIIQTIEIDERPIEPARLPLLMENRFVNWLSAQYQQADIERYIN